MTSRSPRRASSRRFAFVSWRPFSDKSNASERSSASAMWEELLATRASCLRHRPDRTECFDLALLLQGLCG